MFIWLDIKGASIEVNRNTQGYLSFLGSSEILQITELLNSRQECSLNLQAFKQCEFIRKLNGFSYFFKINANI